MTGPSPEPRVLRGSTQDARSVHQEHLSIRLRSAVVDPLGPPPLPTATYRDTVLKVGLLCCSYGEMRVLTGLDLRGGLG